MKETCLNNSNEDSYAFDPSSIIKLISSNPEVGLALIQLPISIANNLIYNHNNLKWLDNPTRPGYYWVKSHDQVLSIKEYSSKDVEMIANSGLSGVIKNLFKFAGPLEPPR
jgi:hypothetical protein